MTYRGERMTIATFWGPFRSGMLAVATIAIAIAGCDGGDDDGSGDTQGATSLPMDDTSGGMDDGVDDDGVDSTSGGMAACGEAPSTSFATDIQPIIEANCVTDCHDPGATGATAWAIFPLSADAGANYDGLVDANSPTNGIAQGGYPLVTACDLDNSYLWDKISTGTRVPEGLCKMPLETYPGECADIEGMLSQADLDTIEQWIMDGAPE
jgi:hypothetical protein